LRDRKSADICIIIPAYNEYKRIGSTIEKQAKEHRKFAVIPAFFAAACKDTLIGALTGGILGSAIRRDKKEVIVWAVATVAYLGCTAWNYALLREYLNVTLDVSRWVGKGGLTFVEQTFKFATPWLWVGWIGFLVGLSVLGVVAFRPFHLSAYAFASTLLPIIVFMIIGQEWDEYWGVVYVPFVLLMVAHAAVVLHRATVTTRLATSLPKSPPRT